MVTTERDLTALVAMRDAAARWQAERGELQWDPGEVGVDEFRCQANAGELFVVHAGSEVVAAVRLVWADHLIWDNDPTDSAGYVHGLMVNQRGTGLDADLLVWAEATIGDAGKQLIRLDCVATNHRLRRYYLNRAVGRSDAGASRTPHGEPSCDSRSKSTPSQGRETGEPRGSRPTPLHVGHSANTPHLRKASAQNSGEQ